MAFFRQWFGLEEAAKPAAAPALAGPAKVKRQGFEYGINEQGLNEWNASIGDSTQSDRRAMMTQLYEAFLTCPWAWACVNAISRTITGGKLVFDFDADDGEGDQEVPTKPPEVLACERLFKFVNPREDIRQLMRGVIADLLVFGDAFIEVAWLAGVPVALYSLDSPSMFPLADQHGEVTGYVQLTEFNQRAEFTPDEVIHISLDSPRSGIFGVSPTQAALLPITAWLFTAATLKEIARKGAPPTVHVDHPASMPDNDSKRWIQQYMGRNLGARNIGAPIVTKGGAVVNQLQQDKIAELRDTKTQARDEILAAYGVPPAEATVIESGNLGGGTGESQRRTYLVNTCQPVASIVLEKIFYHLAQRGFGVQGWHLKFEDVDMRDSLVIEQIRDMRVRNGSYTANKYRTEIGEPTIEGGDDAVIIDRTNIVAWKDIAAFSQATVAAAGGATGNLELDDLGNKDKPLSFKKVDKPVPPPGGMPQPGMPGQPPHPAAAPPAAAPPAAGPTARQAREGWAARNALTESYRERVARALHEFREAEQDDAAA